jgi:hypothetical protein
LQQVDPQPICGGEQPMQTLSIHISSAEQQIPLQGDSPDAQLVSVFTAVHTSSIQEKPDVQQPLPQGISSFVQLSQVPEEEQ